jgi:hypothetical protein
MIAIGTSVVSVSFEELAHFLIVANQRVELDLNGIELKICIKEGLKKALSKEFKDYQSNMNLLFGIAKVECVQFFDLAKEVVKDELREARCDGKSLMEFAREEKLELVEKSIGEPFSGTG